MTTLSSVVIVGANGAGKSRLGAWIELKSSQASLVHRISAQKSLSMPESSSTSTLDSAEQDLRFGLPQSVPRGSELQYKPGHRWANKPETAMLNDYGKLMVYLFSEEFEKSIAFRHAARTGQPQVPPPETKLDIVKRIWESVLPRREILIHAGAVQARARDGDRTSYSGADMSDGERVLFYLIGQCLAVPPNGIVVIDEPELHLHRAVQARVWDAIEAERPDCLFVYITHDLDFATTRIDATKVWVQDYSGGAWDWRPIAEVDGLPEGLLLTVLGTRKPVLFCEGDRGSLDHAIYSQVYPEFAVIPCGGCEAVIHATKSFAALSQLHSLTCRGIVDRDQRSDTQVAYLAGLSVFTSDLAELENALLTEAVLRVVAEELLRPDVAPLTAQVQELVFASLTTDRDRVISELTATQIEARLSNFDATARGRDAISSSLDKAVSSIDAEQLYAENSERVDKILRERVYLDALRIYSNKGMVRQVGPIFGLKPYEYIGYIKRLLGSRRSAAIRSALMLVLPGIA